MQEIKETTSYRVALKDRIMETALKAFSEHGIRAVKMDDIASMLGISKRTLYEIYEDKEKLLFSGIRAYDQRKQDYLRHYAAEEGRHVIDIIMEAYRLKVEETKSVNPLFYADLIKYPEIEHYILESHERRRESFLQFMLRGVDEGYFCSDIDYRQVSHLFDAIGQYIMSNHLFRQYTLEEMFVNMFMISLRGLCTDKGVKTLDEAIAKIQ